MSTYLAARGEMREEPPAFPNRSPYSCYGVALGASLLAAGVLKLLAPFFDEHSPPLVLLTMGVTGAALWGGLGAGLVATVCSVLLTWYAVIPPPGFAIPAGPAIVHLGITLASCLAISVMAGRLYRTEARQRAIAAHLSAEINGHKRTEDALRQAKADWERTFDSVPDLIAILDTDHGIVRVNKAMAERVGRKREALVGERCYRVMHGTDKPPIECPHALAVLDGQPHIADSHEEHLGGEFIESVTPLLDEGGRRVGSVLVAHDITARKKAEAELNESEQRFRALVNSTSDIIYSMTPDWSETHFLKGGVFLADLEGTSADWLERYIPHGEQPRVTAAIQDAIRSSGTFEMEHQVLRADGTTGWTFSRAVAIRDSAGNIVEWFGAASDITERRNAEALRTRLAAIVESSDDAIISYGIDGAILTWNASAERLFGYRADEAIGQPITMLLPPERFMEEHKILGTIKAGQRVEHLETVRVAKDGRLLDVLVSSAPLKDAEGRLAGASKTLRDISERKRAEAALQSVLADLATANATLEQRVATRTAELMAINEELKAFAYTIAHDLRAPLRHVIVFLSQLKGFLPADLGPEARGLLSDTQNESTRMAVLIDDLLKFARLGHAELKTGNVDLALVLDTVLAELLPDTAGRRIEWKIGPLPHVCGDQSLLRQVFVNLLGNAIKFTAPRDPALIEIGVAPETPAAGEEPGTAPFVTLFVRDNGVGYNEAHAAHLFGVFRRLHEPSQFTGTGIGLANVRRIVQRHGGRVWAESVEGQGATFFFSLPKNNNDPNAASLRRTEEGPIHAI